MENKIVRFGISLSQTLIKQFDEHITNKGYSNRSEAIRDLIRKELIGKEIDSNKEVIGILHLLYDHHKRELTDKLNDIQHGFHENIISTSHVHLDHDNCLEVVLLKGKASIVKELSNRMTACIGVKNGRLYLTSTGNNLS